MGNPTKEGQALIDLYDKLVKKKLTDLGARLNGSNAYHLIKEKKVDAILVDMREEHCKKLREALPDSDVRCLKVTPENVNDLVSDETGILCIDIDGNDYWVWKAVKATPQIVVIEYGKRAPNPDWIPEYMEDSPKRFDGAGVDALVSLAKEKGYRLYQKISVNLIFLSNEFYGSIHPSA